jgi:EAL domain-containing protein (putative c-di-GMP-specific phosphodiesterase class I)
VLLAYIIATFKAHNTLAAKITFEITKTAAISNLRAATHFITVLKKQGCQFALDDFGSGLSSFAYLKKLPVDYLKIDGLFVKDILDDPIDHAMVRSINEIGHVMQIKTIAEFIENTAIRQQLEAIGIDFAQGYGISKPFPIEKLLS